MMMKRNKTVRALFSFPGFYAQQKLQGIFGDQKGRVIELRRQKKQLYALVVKSVTRFITTTRYGKYEIWMYMDYASMYGLSNDEFIVPVVEV
jgi:hypothetical protein